MAQKPDITKVKHPHGFIENKQVSKRGGHLAGNARKQLEHETGKKVVSHTNFLPKKI